MPPRRQNDDGSGKPRRKRRMPPRGTEEYKEKRDRNNVAVRKSREKTRVKAKQTVSRVSALREENKMLEQQVEILSKELTILKDLFKVMHEDNHANNAEISVQTEECTGATTVLDDPMLVMKQGTPMIIDVSCVNQALKADHQYVKPEFMAEN